MRLIGSATCAAIKSTLGIAVLVLLALLAATGLPSRLGSARAASEGGPNQSVTTLMFPYVTANGLDTVIVLSNGSMNPLGTPQKSGACTVYFVATSIGGSGTETGSFTTPTLAAGVQYAFRASTGASQIGLSNFQGYVIASCEFPFAYGFAIVLPESGPPEASYVAIPMVKPSDVITPTPVPPPGAAGQPSTGAAPRSRRTT